MIARYSLTSNIRDQEYEQLLQELGAWCPYALFVVRAQLGLNERADNLLKALAPSIDESYEAQEWPGTQLMTGTATVYVVKLAQSCETIARAARGFYDWVQPGLPEDLSLLRKTREPCLVTIAHEKDGYIDLAASEFARLQNSVPRVVEAFRREEPPTE